MKAMYKGCFSNRNDCWDLKTHKEISEYSSRFLWRFVQPNAQEKETETAVLNLTGLKKRDLNLLADIRFLLSPEVYYLLFYIAPKILNRLSKQSVNEYKTDRNKIRGRVDWQNTIKKRAIMGNDSTIYVYSYKSQFFDLPENRLFLYILRYIYEKARNFASDNYSGLMWYAETDDMEKWVDKISVIASKSERLIRNPLISKVANLHEVTNKIINMTKRCRSMYYQKLAGVAEAFLFYYNFPLYYLKKELKNNILEPLNKDTLFEIAVLFKTMGVVMDDGWKEKKAGLIGGNCKYISIFVKENWSLKIFYQKLPKEMVQYSKYGEIMTHYGLSEKLRRPDIILEFNYKGEKKFVIIEVKRSKNRTYLVDGTYKLLGYLKDFERLNNDVSKLQGVLVGWNGIKIGSYTSGKEVYLFNWNDYESGIISLVNSLLKT